MGSYLTIVNDTTETWKCKVGPDMRAITWGVIAAAVTLALASSFAVDAMIPILAPGTNWLVKEGAALVVGGVVAGGTSKVGMAIKNSIDHVFQQKNYDVIKAGESKRYGKMTLSLWRQCECIKTSVNGPIANLDHLMMRPIFSGGTANSNRDHSINWWAHTHGVKRTVISRTDGTTVVT